MNDLLRTACEDFGSLLSIEMSTEFGESATVSDQFDQWTLVFESGRLCVSVDGDDDTVVISQNAALYATSMVLTDIEPWDQLVECTLAWAWMLTNQRGFLDGVQFEFSGTDQSWTIQLIAAASSLTAARVQNL